MCVRVCVCVCVCARARVCVCERERRRDRQAGRQANRQIDRQTDRQRQREGERLRKEKIFCRSLVSVILHLSIHLKGEPVTACKEIIFDRSVSVMGSGDSSVVRASDS